MDNKSNEITAIPRLLELLTLKGALVTIDAMGCQKEIAKKIVEGGGDYILPVKGNQEHLQADIEAAVISAIENGVKGKDFETYDTEDKGHGRHEKRHYTVLPVPKEGIRGKDEWAKLTMIGVCYRERTCKGKTSQETVYFIGSRKMTAKKYGTAMRNHWGIENKLHWHLDVTFGEDRNRVQEKTEAANLGGVLPVLPSERLVFIGVTATCPDSSRSRQGQAGRRRPRKPWWDAKPAEKRGKTGRTPPLF